MQSAERQIRFSVKQEGVITCFLSLVLLLLLALVSVTLESARVAGARFIKDNYTRMAVNSVEAEYSGTLFDRYHLFAVNSRTQSDQGIRDVLETKTAYYINRNLQADAGMLWDFSLEEVTVTDYELLTDRKGAVFRKEAAAYMKYRGTAYVVEQLFSSLGIFQSAEKTVALLEETAKTEEVLAEIDDCILDLFESVDGFVRDEEGIKQNIWGKVKIKSSFVKKLLEGVPTAERAQINHEELFQAVCSHYVRPATVLDALAGYACSYVFAGEQIESIDRRLEEIQIEDMLLNPELKLEQTVLETDRLMYAAKRELARQQYFGELRSWETILSNCQKAGEQAVKTVQIIKRKQELASGTVLQYENKLREAAAWLDSDLYTELENGLRKMKQYVGLETEAETWIPDMEQMQRTLESNHRVLTRTLEVIEEAKTEGPGSGEKTVSRMAAQMREYSHAGLCFDYSNLNLGAEGEAPASSFRELIQNGLMSLVLDDAEEISRAVLTGTAQVKDSTSDELLWMDTSEKNHSSVLAVINSDSPFSGISEWLQKEGEEVLERGLFLSYLAEHFANYRKGTEEPGVLKYEQEYILCGNAEDESNLFGVIGRILSVRLIFNLIHVLGDSEKTTVAGETAAALLGVTGLPILVSMMKFLLLFVWAAEAALVETAALLQGKKLAVIPGKKDFPVAFPELLGMTGERIRQKAENIQEQKGFVLGYSEYMLLFLLLQDEELQSMRALNLIQENLSAEEGGFLVSQMVISFSVQAKYLLPELFTGLPVSKRRTGGYCF